jgi:hypothetical protein
MKKQEQAHAVLILPSVSSTQSVATTTYLQLTAAYLLIR